MQQQLGEVLQGSGQKLPCSPWGTMREQITMQQPVGVQGGAGESDLKKAATHGEFPQEHTLGWSCRPWRGAHTRVGGLMGDAAHGGHAGAVCS